MQKSHVALIEDFLAKLKERGQELQATGKSWRSDLPAPQFLRIVQFLRQWRDHYPTLIADVGEIIDRSVWELQTLIDLSDLEILESAEWDLLQEVCAGSNVHRTRDWSLYPRHGFFGDYLEYTLNSEGPIDFHFFVAATILGGACRRNFVLKFGHANIWPNIWAVLLAPSGACRKSSSINIGAKLLKSVPEITFITTCATPQALIEQLKPRAKEGSALLNEMGGLEFQFTDSHGFIAAPELGVFLGKQQYNEGLIQMLTDLSDNPEDWSKGTKGEGETELHNVALSFLGGITPDSARDALPRAAHGGGFMSRILWVRADTTDRIIARPPPPSPLLREKLRRHLRLIRDAKPASIMLSKEADDFFISWYAALRQGEAARGDEDRLAGFIERKPMNLLRLAVLLFLSDPASQVDESAGIRIGYLSLDLVKQAEEILARITPHQYEAAATVDAAPVGHNMRILRKALWTMTKQGTREVQRSDLMRRVSSRMYRNELDQLMTTLVQSDEVVIIARQRAGRDVTYYALGSKFEL